jgi:hypothetical protein
MLLKKNVSQQVVACWMNADVALGPGGPPQSVYPHMDGKAFLKLCCKIPEVVLSLGWLSTEYAMSKKYSEEMIYKMVRR